ncbi:MAG TPA: cytochrome c3 family protein [Bacteroidota bacterium]|nr:cytochrome c3 family protein [Bacteroidota bacterium]
MSPRAVLCIVGVAVLLVDQPRIFAGDQCVTCHEAMEDAPSKLFSHDVHAAKGLSCADCHGGNPKADDPDVAMNKKAGFIGVPKGDDISRMCAGCHGDPEAMRRYGSVLPTNQWEKLQSSVHGALSTNGKEHIVQCITCHNAHGVLHVKDPASPVYPLNVVRTCTKCHANAAYMRSYNPSIAVDQLDKYRTSLHGIRNAKGDPHTAQCASCHGSHDIRAANDLKSQVYPTNVPSTCARCHSDSTLMARYGIPADQFAKYSRSVHGIALLQKNDAGAPACNSCHGNHGAAPPGVESVSKVCGTCHALNADLFSSSPHKKAFDDRKLPECETCHGNHEIAAASETLLGVSAGSVCGRCHHGDENAAGYKAAKEMRQLADSLSDAEAKARMLIDEAEQKGMEVSEAKFKLRDVHQARLQSRTAVHAFDEARFDEVARKGLVVAEMVGGEGQAAIDEYYFRRVGLGVATIIITILATSLYLFIRRIEKKQA